MQRYTNNIANQKGGAIAGASVLVQNFSDLTTATVYTTNSAIVANVATNPLTSDSNGAFFFYAADGHYNLVVTPPGGVTTTVYDQMLEDILSDPAPLALIASTATWAIGAGAASTATTALAASTATYAISATTATVHQGTTSTAIQAAGIVGEFITAQQATPGVVLGNGTAANITTATLLSGDYDAWGQGDFTPAATSGLTQIKCGINTTSASFAGQDTYGQTYWPLFTPGNVPLTQQTPVQRIAVAGTSTVYMIGLSAFATSSMSAGGTLNFRRRS